MLMISVINGEKIIFDINSPLIIIIIVVVVVIIIILTYSPVK